MRDITKELIEASVQDALQELQVLPIEQDFENIMLSREELEGLEGLSEEELGQIHRAMPFFARTIRKKLPHIPRFRRFLERTIEKPVQKVIEKTSEFLTKKEEYYFYYHGKKPASNADIEYFSTKAPGDRYNFKRDGIQPETDLQIIGIAAFFTPNVIGLRTDVTDILQKMMIADVQLKIVTEEKLKIPLEFIIDWNPVIATTETALTLIYLRNSRLERGILPLSGIVLPKDKTLQITVDFKEAFTNTNYWLFFGLACKKLG